jgi:hypothetical protein
MPRLNPLPLRALTAAAGIGLAALHVPAYATPDWLTAASACTADSAASLQNTTVVASEGLLRHGREPPARYICPVWNADDFAPTPSWQGLVLTYIDPSSAGGKVKASLYAKSRTGTKASLIATVTSAGGSSRLQTTRATLRKTLDFSLNAYYVVLFMDMADSALAPNEAHMVRLEN